MKAPINRRQFLAKSSAAAAAIELSAFGGVVPAADISPAVPNKSEHQPDWQLLGFKDVLPLGEIDRRLRTSIGHLRLISRARLVDDLANPDRPWSYGPEYTGRWLEVLSVAARLPAWNKRDTGIRQAAEALYKFQQPNGMFGKREDNTGWLSAGRGLMGLIETYATFGYPEVLEAARKLVDYFDKHFPRRPAQRACMGLRDLVRYAEVSGDERGLKIARRMYDDCFELGPDWPFEKVSGNLHLYINIHRGLVDLYRHTGDQELLDQAIALRDWLKGNVVWVSGGINEWLDPSDCSGPAAAGNEDPLFFKDAAPPARIRDETCTTGDWMMLNLELAQATGEDRYTETAEHAFWNHFLAGQADNGGWCAHRDLIGMAGTVWDFCCSLHGPRCLMEAMRHVLVRSGNGLRLNLHAPVAASFSWPGAKAEATVEFDPNLPGYAIAFGKGTDGRFAVRVPTRCWAKDLHVKASGKQISNGPNGDIVVAGRWRRGDRIVCGYRPAVIIHTDTITPPTQRCAVQRGPLMLAATDIDTTTQDAPPVKVSCEKTAKTRRIIIDLDGRFDILLGLFWVSPHMVDWEHPDRGITFFLSADGDVVRGSRQTAVQGFMPTSVVGTVVKGKRQLVIETTSTHPDFPIDAARFTSLRLFTREGDVVPLDDYLDGGQAPVQQLRVSAAEVRKLLSADIRQWPRPLRTEAGGQLSLLPMKDLPKLLRPEGGIGHSAPIANTDFSVLLPMGGK